jgi:hypothetical protein
MDGCMTSAAKRLKVIVIECEFILPIRIVDIYKAYLVVYLHGGHGAPLCFTQLTEGCTLQLVTA